VIHSCCIPIKRHSIMQCLYDRLIAVNLRVIALCALLCDCEMSRPTSYLIEADRALGVRELVKIAHVLRAYRDATPAELNEARAKLSRMIDGLVDIEVEEMMKLEPARPKPRAKTIVRVAARARVIERLGKEFALPMLSSESRSVVMFGKVNGDLIEMTPTAYELDVAVKDLPVGSQIAKRDGSKATLLNPSTTAGR
jgi:hypothetical protein